MTLFNFPNKNSWALGTNPKKPVPIKEQNRLKKLGINLDFMQSIQPEGGITFDDDHAIAADGPFSILTITKYQKHPKLNWLMQFSHQNNAIMLMDVVTNETSKVKSEINRSLNELIDRAGNGRYVTDMDEAKNEIQELREYAQSLGSDGEISKSILIRLVVYDSTQERLEQHVSEIKRDLKSNGYHAIPRFWVQADEFKTINEPLPEQLKVWNKRGIDTKRDIQAMQAHVLGGGANFNAQQLNDPKGIYLGSTSTGGAFIFDQFLSTKQRLSFNIMVLGKMGSGKSTLLKMLEEGSFARNMFIRGIDKTGEYSDLIKSQGGTIVSLDGKKGHMLNPLQVLATVMNDHNEVDEIKSFQQHLTKLKVLVKMISNNALNEFELNELTKLLRIYYIEAGLLPTDWQEHPEKIKISTFDPKQYPTFSDFHGYLKKLITPEFIQKNNFSANKQIVFEHIESVIDNICNENGDLFDGYTDLGDLSDRQVLYFNMQNLSGASEAVQRAQIYMALSMIWNHALIVGRYQNDLVNQGKIRNEDRQYFNVFLDECHNIINAQNLEGTRYVTNFSREMRKFGGGTILATQSPQEMAPDTLESADLSILKEPFEFAQYKINMKMDPSQMQKVDLLMGNSLSATDRENIPQMERGESIISMDGSKNRYNVTFEPTNRQLNLFKGGQ